MRLEKVSEDISWALASRHPNTTLTWLGQAGFLIKGGDGHPTVLIDPYLSDSLAHKYAGKRFPHTRLSPVPVRPSRLRDVDVVLCTHRHTDHMDPQTLISLAGASRCVFVVPQAWVSRMAGFGIAERRIIGATEGRTLVVEGVRVTPVLAAHEEIERDSLGRSLHLGYVVSINGRTIYHSGDCCPYPGQSDVLKSLDIEIALLPVNGRDSVRRSNGVPGNFHPSEAFTLAKQAGAEVLVAHHFGLFDFNTVDQSALDHEARESGGMLSFLQPSVAATYEVIADV